MTDAELDAFLNQLLADGLLDEQFSQLMQLQDESNPHFVAEVVELYFEDSGTKLEKLNAQLSSPGPPDFNAVDQVVHQFKGSSASFGAQQIAQLCVHLREACQRQDREACQQLLVQVKQRFEVLHSKLGTFMQLENQNKLAHGIIR